MFDGRVLVCDGAMGTMLNAVGFPLSGALCELSLSRPEAVTAVHRAYVAAGADVIETNSFLACRTQLARHGLAERVREINLAAARLAREAAGGANRRVLVAGAVGPATTTAVWRHADPAAVRDAFREQVAALAEGGVDLILLETFGSLAELREAVAAAGEAAPALPVIGQMYFMDNGRTLAGERPAEVAACLSDLGVIALGVNCIGNLETVATILGEMAAATALPLAAQPNAGSPALVAGTLRYSSPPEEFAAYTRRYAALGARLIGGCCGTTPEHVRAVRHALAALTPEADKPFVPLDES